jgi:hypothetical protein
MIRRRGLEDEPDALPENDPGLAALYAAAVRGRIATGPNAGNRVAVRRRPHRWRQPGNDGESTLRCGFGI